MKNRNVKLVAVLSLALSSSVAFAAPNTSGSPVAVHFYIGANSTDQEMKITNFTAVGDTDCTKPTTGNGVCKQVLYANGVNNPIDFTYPKTADFSPGFKMSSANPADQYATGSLTVSFNVVLAPSGATFPITYNFVNGTNGVTEGSLPTFYIGQLPGTGNATCDFNVVAAASKGTASSITFSCVD